MTHCLDTRLFRPILDLTLHEKVTCTAYLSIPESEQEVNTAAESCFLSTYCPTPLFSGFSNSLNESFCMILL